MYEYDLILEELNERVECGELTLEEAELINDYAYDKYVIEKEKNKETDDARTEENKKRKLGEKLHKLSPAYRADKLIDKVDGKFDKIDDAFDKINDKLDEKDDERWRQRLDDHDKEWKSKTKEMDEKEKRMRRKMLLHPIKFRRNIKRDVKKYNKK